MHGVRARVLPPPQRRSLEELTGELDLRSGDVEAKRSAFWTMLVLSAVIASAGVLADSTATVIGAMIIAPLSTPIMGIALAVVKRQRNGSMLYVAGGALLVITIGALFALVSLDGTDIADNSQVSSRTSPDMLDLVAAVATGFAGAIALARRDVAAVLPGVAIAISLVPPLAVFGVCLGHGELRLGAGALVLFLSNLLALVLAGIATFAVLGYATEAMSASVRARRRPYLVVGALMVLVAIPLGANSLVNFALATWTERSRVVATQWLADTPGAEVTDVEFVSLTVRIHVRHSGDLPPVDDLSAALEDVLPDGVAVVVDSTVGREIDAGTTGQD